MSFARSAEPLFGDSDTYPLIEHIANQRSLVIYASAGVTIDRTGMSWPDVVEKLLREHKDNADGPDFGPPVPRSAASFETRRGRWAKPGLTSYPPPRRRRPRPLLAHQVLYSPGFLLARGSKTRWAGY